MQVLEAGKSLLKQYHRLGYEAYFVGGCVRDLQLGIPITDIDICTNALPEASMKAFQKVIPTGIPYGTVTVFWEGQPFEVTTYRQDNDYKDGRRPKDVHFVSKLEEDLKRRDFTINAMALDLEGNLIDPFGGMYDLQLGLIRTVGNAQERFFEDGLRILRAIRFAASLDFVIEESTWQAIVEHKAMIAAVARERIVNEMDKILLSQNRDQGLMYLEKAQLLYKYKDGVEPISLENVHDLDLLWAYVLYITDSANGVKFNVRDLPFSRERKRTIRQLHKLVEEFSLSEEELLKLTYHYRLQFVLQLIAFNYMINGHTSLLTELKSFEERWHNLPAPNPADIELNGEDLINLFPIKPGPWISEMLYHLWCEVNFNRLSNHKETLLHYIMQNKRIWNL